MQARGLQGSAATSAQPCVSADDCPGLDAQLLDKSYYIEKVVTPVPATASMTVKTGRIAIEGSVAEMTHSTHPLAKAFLGGGAD